MPIRRPVGTRVVSPALYARSRREGAQAKPIHPRASLARVGKEAEGTVSPLIADFFALAYTPYPERISRPCLTRDRSARPTWS
ncbi:hypothetical protein [Chlorobium sp. N1]|uniref:hypothetical protein n=1 Tax=Chlorobium sp. N1 TaxID=2491138 RepID=UPI0013F149A4|nr:hypothetical protein [Chlorobium sp. N1]